AEQGDAEQGQPEPGGESDEHRPPERELAGRGGGRDGRAHRVGLRVAGGRNEYPSHVSRRGGRGERETDRGTDGVRSRVVAAWRYAASGGPRRLRRSAAGGASPPPPITAPPATRNVKRHGHTS